MFKFLYIFFVSICFSLFISACVPTSTERDAALLTIDKLRFTPGYEWYDIEFQKYNPNPFVISQIRTILQNKDFNYYIFVNPSCACTGTQKQFPAIMKILSESSIPENKLEIYSMIKTSNNHPHRSKLKINELPSFFIARDSINMSSVLDTLAARKSMNSNYDPALEELFLELISKL